MQDEIQKLKKFLEQEKKDCFEQEEEETLTKEGDGMVLMIDSIYNHMRWEPIKLTKRKICKLTIEENKFWEKTSHYYINKGHSEDDMHKLTTEATKKKFPRLKDCNKLI